MGLLCEKQSTVSPGVDAAWKGLGIEWFLLFRKRNESGFFVNVEGLHHLHCLNIVRKALYFNYDYYRAIRDNTPNDEDDIIRFHVNTVRQVLMCNVDMGVLGQHKCKNCEAVLERGKAHQAPPNEELPPGYVAYRMTAMCSHLSPDLQV
ncbi:hypothetical protein B0T26DRAFT_795177 [Lasiosphaeria miniovina]|uniref:Uncharacterized protein n=1 Tax=Lasiosphaeria miniovina TaxID=1954250 RepID=A0AA40DG15_9PEZI|nr:uncharacterized protein B0T26DRAFT_795177 [Lasiosphaeria miniovina]KAK0701690.1 hypothetical protein B0T26DRAFT_795177 [Lasiosphaeria miniovina]